MFCSHCLQQRVKHMFLADIELLYFQLEKKKQKKKVDWFLLNIFVIHTIFIIYFHRKTLLEALHFISQSIDSWYVRFEDINVIRSLFRPQKGNKYLNVFLEKRNSAKKSDIWFKTVPYLCRCFANLKKFSEIKIKFKQKQRNWITKINCSGNEMKTW